MRFTIKDTLATVLVATGLTMYVLWATDAALTSTSTRAVAVIVFALGFAGCLTDQRSMASVYGAEGRRRASMPYIVLTTAVGVLALVSGILAFVLESVIWVAILTVAMVALWLLATGRHVLRGSGRHLLGHHGRHAAGA